MTLFTDCEFGYWDTSGTSCCENDFLLYEPENSGKGNCGDKLGDCDYDNQCHRGMKCGTNNCPVFGWGVSFDQDCCFDEKGKRCMIHFSMYSNNIVNINLREVIVDSFSASIRLHNRSLVEY